MLSTDGSEGDAYDAAPISWSPDSRHIAAYRVRPGYRREVHYVESSPEDQLQPRYSSLMYSKPGDVLMESPLPVRRRYGEGEEPDHEGRLGGARRGLGRHH
jgi:hypothetical protein